MFLQSNCSRLLYIWTLPNSILWCKTCSGCELLEFQRPCLARKRLCSETSLLEHLETLVPPEIWTEYQNLRGQQDAGTLAGANRKRLLELSDEMERLEATRLEVLQELAQLRGQSLREVMSDLALSRGDG